MQNQDAAVRLAVLQGFVDRGHAPIAPEIAQGLGLAMLDVETSLKRLHEQHLLVLAPGTPYVWMANPFSALPTPFRVTGPSGSWWGNCIWDSLGIVAVTGRSGHISTWCPDCSESLEIEVRDGELVANDYIVHFAVPAAHWWDDIGFN